jgi:hypothetical protein
MPPVLFLDAELSIKEFNELEYSWHALWHVLFGRQCDAMRHYDAAAASAPGNAAGLPAFHAFTVARPWSLKMTSLRACGRIWLGFRSNAELHAFRCKVEQKAAWTRGLYVSYTGFSEDGLHAFGRGKRVICMDGYDLSEALSRELPLNHVLERKVRRAAETGLAFVRIRDLF